MSEEAVSKVVDVIEEEYENPFGVLINKDKLVNISSGLPLDDDSADTLLSMVKTGEAKAEEFRKKRLILKEVPFHDAIKKNGYKTFRNIFCKTQVKKKDGNLKVAEVNRNILGTLNSYSIKTGRAVDFEKALSYPLSPVPLSISNPDGSRRSTAKSKLKDILLQFRETTVNEEPDLSQDSAILVDMIALINTINETASTYAEFAKAFVKRIPRGYKQVDIIADCYQNPSIKRAEQLSRGESESIHIASLQSRIPSDFKFRILRNADNKKRLIDLMFEFIESQAEYCLGVLDTTKIVLSSDNNCISVSATEKRNLIELKSSQEEADTKLILHSYYLLKQSTMNVSIYSPSGDTDIIVLALAHLQEYKQRVYLIDGHGQFKRTMKLIDFNIETEILESLIGFHAFTGNDYISSFFRKGKAACFKILKGNSKFQKMFAELGENWNISDDLYKKLEEYVCQLYGVRKANVNNVRYTKFKSKLQNENKIVDLSTLPPCRSVLSLHCKRANYVARIWKLCKSAHLQIPSIHNHGWNEYAKTCWIENPFPSDIEEILISNDYSEDEVFDEEGESEVEDEMFL